MINKVFAQNFVNKMQRSMNLMVNVMDERGVIIASATKERVGDFHVCAYEIIQKNLPMLVTKQPTKELIGVNAPGVNLRLTSGNETIGVIGVTGDPAEVTNIARMVKLTFETMYEYEYKKNISMKGNAGVWNLAHILLLETPFNERAVKRATTRLKYADHYPRMPIYIRLHSEFLQTVIDHLMTSYSTLRCYHHQDICLPVEHGILLMKAAPASLEQSETEIMDNCVSILEKDFMEREDTSQNSLGREYYRGPVQLDYSGYAAIYQSLLWLSERTRKGEPGPYALMDYLPSFLTENSAAATMTPLFEYYSGVIKDHMDPAYFMETAECLVHADMRLDDAASLLHLHKNSVIARLKKIKELLGINPIASPKDAAFLACLCSYMRMNA